MIGALCPYAVRLYAHGTFKNQHRTRRRSRKRPRRLTTAGEVREEADCSADTGRSRDSAARYLPSEVKPDPKSEADGNESQDDLEANDNAFQVHLTLQVFRWHQERPGSRYLHDGHVPPGA